MEDETARFRKLVELNATNSAENLCHSTIVQNAWKNGQNLTVHAWTYDLSDGYVLSLIRMGIFLIQVAGTNGFLTSISPFFSFPF